MRLTGFSCSRPRVFQVGARVVLVILGMALQYLTLVWEFSVLLAGYG
jgi:hypothetical protein